MELTYSPLQSGVGHLDVLLMSSISFVICVDTQTKRRRSTSLVVLVAVDVPAFAKSLQYFSELLAPHLYRHCHLVRNTGSSLFLLGPSLLLVVYRSASFQVKYVSDLFVANSLTSVSHFSGKRKSCLEPTPRPFFQWPS